MKLGEKTPLRKGEKRTKKVTPKFTSTLGGKFTSLPDGKSQAENAALVVRLCGEIGVDGYATLDKYDKIFIDDVRIKLRTTRGQPAMFGWRQVEAMVRIHGKVMADRKEGGQDGAGRPKAD